MDLEGFLRPRLRDLADPFLLPDMKLAVERILAAADRDEKVCIYGDYDVDGVTSITLMRRILHAYGIEARHFIPRRGPEGYGLSKSALARCMEEGPKPDLLIILDLDVDTALSRIGARGDTANEFEKRDALTRCREIFLSLNKEPFVHVVSTDEGPEKVQQKLRGIAAAYAGAAA